MKGISTVYVDFCEMSNRIGENYTNFAEKEEEGFGFGVRRVGG
jgi:hypothetical protein